MDKFPSLSIFFPAYNEERNIGRTIEKAIPVAEALTENQNYEIIVINDGSRDGTAAEVNEITSHNPHVHLINHPQNMGYGAALMSGFLNSSKDWVFFTDGDGQFDIRELEQFLPLTQSTPVIVGYRLKRNDHFLRLINAKGWSLLNRIAFQLDVIDIDCAFKLFRRDVLSTILPQLNSRGAMISAELLIRLNRAGHQINEVGVNHYPRTAGSPTGAKPTVILRAFKELATVYRGDLGSEWVKQVIKFMFVGISNTLVDLTIYFLLSRLFIPFQSRKVWAKGVAYIFGLTNSFVWNRAWTFKSTTRLTSLIPFIIFGVAGLAINTSVMYVCYTALNFGELTSLAIATIITFSWNFITSKYVVFK